MRSLILLTTLLTLCAFTPAWGQTSEGRYHALRLHPGQDLKAELNRYIEENRLKACAVVACVGSLTVANLRFAEEPRGAEVEGPLEILSLSGCGGQGKWHLHLSVADKTGRMWGGHLMDGNIVRTTAEIVMVELADLQFDREQDPDTGYPELRILPKKPI